MLGTADDTTIQYYDRLSTSNLTVVTNDPTSLQTYKGLEFTLTKRMSNRWQMLAGYTYSQARITGLSVNTDPNRLLNVTGPITAAGNGNVAGTGLGDRPNSFKLTGTYLLPFQDILVAANFSSVSGEALTRQVNTRLSVGGTTTVNVEPLGTDRLDALNKLDLRAQKNFRLEGEPRARRLHRRQQRAEHEQHLGRADAERDDRAAPERRHQRPAEHRGAVPVAVADRRAARSCGSTFRSGSRSGTSRSRLRAGGPRDPASFHESHQIPTARVASVSGTPTRA